MKKSYVLENVEVQSSILPYARIMLNYKYDMHLHVFIILKGCTTYTTTAQFDVKSLQRCHGILRTDLEEAHSKEKQMTRAFEVMKIEMDQIREWWQQVQARLVSKVERTSEENTGLKQAITVRNAELDKVRQEREATIRRHRQAQAELGIVKLKLMVAKDDVQKARTGREEQMKENDRLRKELGKKAFSAQANLKRIVEKFREQTNVAIQVATATTLQSWAEQAAELQVLREDPGFGSWIRQTAKQSRRI
jgi:hypothetical protein